MNKYIQRILKNTVEGDFISLALLDRNKIGRDGKKGVFFENLTDKGSHFSESYYNKVGFCNYISLNTFLSKSRTIDNISNLNGFMFDFDDGDIPKLVSRVESVLGVPTWKVLTTPSKGKTQLIYLFSESENRVELWEKVSYSLTLWAKSDSQTWDLSRVIRMPGSVNGKNGEKTIVYESAAEYSLDYFVEIIEGNDLIKLVDKPAVSKSPRADNTKKKKNENNSRERFVNKGHKYYDEYLEYEKSKPSPSEARMAFIWNLVWKKKLNDRLILNICEGLGLDMIDCDRILPKVRNYYKK
jgi:hypothetical protein